MGVRGTSGSDVVGVVRTGSSSVPDREAHRLLLLFMSHGKPRDLQRLIHSEHQESRSTDCVNGKVVGGFKVTVAVRGAVVLPLESSLVVDVAASSLVVEGGEED